MEHIDRILREVMGLSDEEIADAKSKLAEKDVAAKAEKKAALKAKASPGYTLYEVGWTEYERGWGQRYDGPSFHLTEEDAKAFIDGYNKTFNNKASAPDDYSQATSGPKLVKAPEDAYLAVLQKKESEDKTDYPWRKLGIWLGSSGKVTDLKPE
jgi:hypothetical protein